MGVKISEKPLCAVQSRTHENNEVENVTSKINKRKDNKNVSSKICRAYWRYSKNIGEISEKCRISN